MPLFLLGVRQLINYIMDFFHRLWKMISDIQIVALAVTIGAAGTKLFGENFWAVLFLSYAAVFVDTATKWVAITKRYFKDNGIDMPSTWQKIKALFFGAAWSPGYLTSRYFSRILEKLVSYTLIISLCYAAGKWLPVLDILGIRFNPATVFPASASTGVFLVELSSINENLKEMGQTGIAEMLSKLVNLVTSKILPKAGG
jgi:hypothetical protein